MPHPISPDHYSEFADEIRVAIRKAQLEAYRKINKSIIDIYWFIGQRITENQGKYRWGKAVVENLSMFSLRAGHQRKSLIHASCEFWDMRFFQRG